MQGKTYTSKDRGDRGEDVAVRYLEGERFRILERNFRTKLGEIDIIARKEKTLYFIEVKSRGSSSLIDPLEAVTPRKMQRIRRVAELYLMRHPELARAACSFGVIGIDHGEIPPRIECVLDAFC